MNTFFTDNIYILCQNNDELNRINNYIKKHKININYELIKSVKIDDSEVNTDRNKEYDNDYLNLCLKKYKDYKLNKNQISHIKSIKKILLDAINSKYKSITILEYDVYFHKNFFTIF